MIFPSSTRRVLFVYDASGKAGTIVLAAPSKGRVTIRVHGVTAHAGNEPEKGLNALKVAADLIMQLPDGRLSPVSTANFSIIEAGSATNVVCDLVTITGEQRSRDAKEYQQISADIEAAADRISEKYHTKIEVELATLYHAFKLAETARLRAGERGGRGSRGSALLQGRGRRYGCEPFQ